MYRFIDTTEKSVNKLPTEAINIDGFFLDLVVPEFTTITVDGRESLSTALDNYSMPKVDGEKIRSVKLEKRVLTVRYFINAKTIDDYHVAMQKLKNYLYKKDILKVFFNDESNVYYEGYLTAFSQPETNYIRSMGSFEITCPLPYKNHTSTKQVVKNGTKVTTNMQRPTKLRKMVTSTLTTAVLNLEVKIGNYKLRLVGLPATNGKKLTFDFQNLKVFLGTQEITSYIDVFSDFGNIRVSNGDVVSSTSISEFEIDVEAYDL